MKILPNNIAVLEDDPAASKWVQDAGRLDYDVHLPANYLRHIPRGGVALDVGAFIGDHTIAYMRATGVHENVHAFECNPEAVECLSHNCPGCRIHSVALSDQEEDLFFHKASSNAGGSFVSRDIESKVVISAVTLDSFNLPRVDFIKWDTEGFETYGLIGAKETLLRCRPVMMIEVIDPQLARAGSSAHALKAVLEWLHYSFKPCIGDLTMKKPDTYYELLCLPL